MYTNLSKCYCNKSLKNRLLGFIDFYSASCSYCAINSSYICIVVVWASTVLLAVLPIIQFLSLILCVCMSVSPIVCLSLTHSLAYSLIHSLTHTRPCTYTHMHACGMHSYTQYFTYLPLDMGYMTFQMTKGQNNRSRLAMDMVQQHGNL